MAEDRYELVPRESPLFVQAEMGRSEALFQQGREDAAIEVLHALARDYGNLAAVHTALGDALRREEWLGDTSVNLGRFFSKMFAGSLDAHIEAVKLETGSESYWGDRNARMETGSGSSEKIDAPEAEWLVERIGRDGVLHENEKELLGFLKRESPHIHPALHPLLEKVA